MNNKSGYLLGRFCSVIDAIHFVTMIIAIIVLLFAAKINALLFLLFPLVVVRGYSSVLLWKGKKQGFYLSLFVSLLSLIDLHTSVFSIYLMAGLYINLQFPGFSIDIVALFQIIILFLYYVSASAGHVETTESLVDEEV